MEFRRSLKKLSLKLLSQKSEPPLLDPWQRARNHPEMRRLKHNGAVVLPVTCSSTNQFDGPTYLVITNNSSAKEDTVEELATFWQHKPQQQTGQEQQKGPQLMRKKQKQQQIAALSRKLAQQGERVVQHPEGLVSYRSARGFGIPTGQHQFGPVTQVQAKATRQHHDQAELQLMHASRQGQPDDTATESARHQQQERQPAAAAGAANIADAGVLSDWKDYRVEEEQQRWVAAVNEREQQRLKFAAYDVQEKGAQQQARKLSYAFTAALAEVHGRLMPEAELAAQQATEQLQLQQGLALKASAAAPDNEDDLQADAAAAAALQAAAVAAAAHDPVKQQLQQQQLHISKWQQSVKPLYPIHAGDCNVRPIVRVYQEHDEIWQLLDQPGNIQQHTKAGKQDNLRHLLNQFEQERQQIRQQVQAMHKRRAARMNEFERWMRMEPVDRVMQDARQPQRWIVTHKAPDGRLASETVTAQGAVAAEAELQEQKGIEARAREEASRLLAAGAGKLVMF